MFRIRNEQMEAFRVARASDFVVRMTEELYESFPEIRADFGTNFLHLFIHASLIEAATYEIQTDAHLRAFIILLFEIHLYLVKPSLPVWIDAIMSQTRMPVPNRMRLLALRIEHALESLALEK